MAPEQLSFSSITPDSRQEFTTEPRAISTSAAGHPGGPDEAKAGGSAPLPFTFDISNDAAVDPVEADAVHHAQRRFAGVMQAAASATGSDSPEYAERWSAAKASHDDSLRLWLGSEAFFRLSALAVQQRESASNTSGPDTPVE